jgi:WD40 repeat protein
VFSPDGSRVASGPDDRTVRVWDVQTGQCEHTLEGHSPSVTSVVFSPDGSRVASGSSDRTVRVWDVASTTELFCYGSGTYHQTILFGSNGSRPVLAHPDSMLCRLPSYGKKSIDAGAISSWSVQPRLNHLLSREAASHVAGEDWISAACPDVETSDKRTSI